LNHVIRAAAAIADREAKRFRGPQVAGVVVEYRDQVVRVAITAAPMPNAAP
jgi:hypothetical protein